MALAADVAVQQLKVALKIGLVDVPGPIGEFF